MAMRSQTKRRTRSCNNNATQIGRYHFTIVADTTVFGTSGAQSGRNPVDTNARNRWREYAVQKLHVHTAPIENCFQLNFPHSNQTTLKNASCNGQSGNRKRKKYFDKHSMHKMGYIPTGHPRSSHYPTYLNAFRFLCFG